MKITIYSGVSYRHMVQRPSMLARALARAGHSVTFVTPAREERKQIEDGVVLRDSVPQSQDILWVSSGWAVTLLGRVKYRYLVMDVLDDDSVHGCPPSSTRLIEKRAHLVFAVCRPLYERLKKQRDHVFLLHNAVENNWASESGAHEAKAIYAGSFPVPWLAIKPIYRIADAGTDIVMAGGAIIHNHEFAMPDHPNIIHKGIVPYKELPQLLSSCKVGLIPFNDSIISHYADPIKLYQYLACGLSILVTPYVPLPFTHEQIHVAEPHLWPNIVREAIERHDPSACREAVRGHTWEDRMKTIEEAFNEAGIT